MIELVGKYNKAFVMIDNIDEATLSQIYSFLNHPAYKNIKIVIMPDTHAGAGSVIGYTSTMNEFIVPNCVGVDIGCSVESYLLGEFLIDFEKFDGFVRKHIPFGHNNREKTHSFVSEKDNRALMSNVDGIVEKIGLDREKVHHAIGSLGGGNHFIEIDKDAQGRKWLVLHSGSRNFGFRVATYHQKKAKIYMQEIYGTIAAYKDSEYLAGSDAEEYFDDMRVAQKYAELNRKVMAMVMLQDFFGLKYQNVERIFAVHNYIDFKDEMIRKGAISAKRNERVLIPFNMRDGVAVGTGKGNEDWNNSAPHGAGRLLARNQAKKILSLEQYREQMKGIWTSCVSKDTLDEAPGAYKDSQMIIKSIQETVDIDFLMKPVYNFKA